LFGLDTYPQALALLETGTLDELFLNQNQNSLEFQIAKAVKQASPSNVTEVKIKLSAHTPSPHYFSYTHSLRNHFGNCQRFHGHSNIIEVFVDDDLNFDLSLAAKELLADRYLVAKDYQSEFLDPVFDRLKSYNLNYTNKGHRMSEHSPYAWVSYLGSQGAVHLVLPISKPIWLNDESSIENISAYVLAALLNQQPQLKFQNIKVMAYEGLGKGAVSRSSAQP
jgi:6-pyruvoyl-tetrahydropterin synthase